MTTTPKGNHTSVISIIFLTISILGSLVLGMLALQHSITNREAIRKSLEGKLEEARQLIKDQ